ncbi:MAG: YeeE/YedE family protein [Polyangiales bacterium]
MKRQPHVWLALASGLLFGVGLVVSGMTQPQKVLDFLDPLGDFDPSLILVMVGAIGVHLPAYWMIRKRAAPLYAARFSVPTRRDIDVKLLAGAFLFGAGWGLGGYCPGPALVALPAGHAATLVFVAAMLAGMFLTAQVEAYLKRRRDSPRAAASAAAPTE